MHRFTIVYFVSLVCLTSPVFADFVRIAATGDSLTDEYLGFSYSTDGDRSWVELLRTHRPTEFAIDNFARAGAKTFDLITQGQASAAAQRLNSNRGYFGTIIVGANDLTTANLVPIINGDLEPIRQAISLKIEAILDAMDGIPPRSLIVFNLPDFRLNPTFSSILDSLPTLKPIAENALNTINNEIRQSVLAHDQILVDFFSLTTLAASGSFPLAGVQVTDFFAPDNIHLNNIARGPLRIL